jgi:hypothetical protein
MCCIELRQRARTRGSVDHCRHGMLPVGTQNRSTDGPRNCQAAIAIGVWSAAPGTYERVARRRRMGASTGAFRALVDVTTEDAEGRPTDRTRKVTRRKRVDKSLSFPLIESLTYGSGPSIMHGRVIRVRPAGRGTGREFGSCSR